ncbi:MAG: Stp1/IreP family PP2C-type Ser/Thr phosphatase [Thermodesulfobacteriota bacterium]|nr:Stp1/IreP family PP2C-type Ser/Thr phosphatase [Thermodesulfobacteriota bacterium]
MEFITIGAVSHPGLKRLDNQDHYAYYFPEEDIADTKGILMTVADGMGGHAAGAVASRLAVDVLMSKYYDAESSASITESLRNAFLKANQEVMARGQDDRKLQGMGATMTAVVVVNNKMYYAHVGDSRGYIISGNKISQFTQDHSYVYNLVRAGIISEEKALTHPQRNVITRAIGISSDLEVDVSQHYQILKKGECVLLCSDGLFNVVSDQEILNVVSTIQTPAESCNKLLEIANARGGPDNITVLAARMNKTNAAGALHGTVNLSRVT